MASTGFDAGRIEHTKGGLKMYKGIVTANKLNVRPHPAYDAPVVDTLEKNQEIR